MTSCKDVLDQISSQLHGWGSTADRVTPLTTGIGPSDSSFTVDFAFGQSVGIAPGVVEIDGEQLYVTSVDATTGVCQLANGFGRGYKGTTATSHSAGAMVVSRPRFPRLNLLQKANDIIGSVYPQLFVPKTWTGSVTYPSNTYTLTGGGTPLTVLDAQWQDPVGNWHHCQSYELDPFDQSFRLGSGAMIGRPLRVVYTTEPATFAAETDDWSVTGLPTSCVDVVVLGAVAALLPGVDISRTQTTSVEQSDRNRVVAPGAAVNASHYVEALYQNRLSNEAASLRKRYRPKVRRVSS